MCVHLSENKSRPTAFNIYRMINLSDSEKIAVIFSRYWERERTLERNEKRKNNWAYIYIRVLEKDKNKTENTTYSIHKGSQGVHIAARRHSQLAPKSLSGSHLHNSSNPVAWRSPFLFYPSPSTRHDSLNEKVRFSFTDQNQKDLGGRKKMTKIFNRFLRNKIFYPEKK